MQIIGYQAVKSYLIENKTAKKMILSTKIKDKKDEMISLAREYNIKVIYNDEVFKKFRSAHQGILLEVDEYKYLDLEEFLEMPLEQRKIIAVLDSLNDVGNLGSLIRSASVFGVSAIIISKDRSVHVNPTVLKIAQGGINDVKIIEVVNISRALKRLKEDKYFIVASDMDGEDIQNMITPPIAIIIGSEEKGIRKNVLKEADQVLKIPQNENSSVNCLNASVAGAIFFYEAKRRLK